jgi:hypothetical protein
LECIFLSGCRSGSLKFTAHWTCPNSTLSSRVLPIPCQKFQSGVDDTEPVQTVREGRCLCNVSWGVHLSTDAGREASLRRQRLETHEALVQRERGSEWGTRYIRPLQLNSHSLSPSQPEKVFSNLVRTIGSWAVGTSTHSSSISVTINPLPDIETKKLCVPVV